MIHQSPSSDDWSLGRIISACWRYKWRGSFVCLLVIAAAGAALYIMPKVYASEAKLFVRLGRENMGLDPTVTAGNTVDVTATRDTEMNSILEHLRSQTLLEKVLETTDPAFTQLSAVDQQLAVRKLQQSISVDSPRGSTVIVLHLEGLDPVEAQGKLETFIDVYLADHIRINRNLRSHDFFEAQSKLLKQQLGDARNELRDAKTTAGIASIEGHRASLEGQIDKAELKLQETDASLSAVAAERRSLERSLQTVPEVLLAQFVEGTPNDGLAVMRQRLFELQTREKEILSKFTPAHPEAVAIAQLVQEVETALAQEEHDREKLMQAVLARKEADEASLTAQQGELRKQLTQLKGKLKTLNQHEATIGGLSDEVAQLESKYMAYLGDREQARLDDALRTDQITNVSILQEATLAPLPIRPQKASVLLLAGVIGMLAGLGVVLTSEQFTPKYPPNSLAAAHRATESDDNSEYHNAMRPGRNHPEWEDQPITNGQVPKESVNITN